MKQFLILIFVFCFGFTFSQMTEIKSNKTQIGSIESSMSKTMIFLERVNNEYYVLAFVDNLSEKSEVVILKETPQTMYSFFKSVYDNYNDENVKEKIFKSGEYKIIVDYLGSVPNRHTAISFDKKSGSKSLTTPFLNAKEWSSLFNDIDKK